jgi:peptidoglycan/LPS O-acetylase OafA/YrhL
MTLTQTRAPRRAAAAPVRERAIDGLRALAILGVVCGHWMVGALGPAGAGGGLAVDSPLRTFDWLAPATWLLQMLGLFFLVGGYSAANSLRRARGRGETDGAWLRRRYRRLAWPVLGAVTLVTAALPLAAAAGVPAASLRVWAVLVVQPLWFIGIYAVITALTPLALALDRRYGWAAALPMVGAVAVLDVARYGPHVVPEWAGYLTVVPAWMFTYQLGVAWARGGFDRRVAWGLLAGGAALFAGLLVVAHYPLSMVTVPGSARSNSNPPSLLVPALAAVQAGAAILVRGRLERALHRHPRVWTAVATLNLFAMSLFCWHQTALVAVSAGAARLGHLPGLTDAPLAPVWVAQRVAWFPVLGVVLAGLAALVGRFERPSAPATGLQRLVAGAAALAFTGYLVAVY